MLTLAERIFMGALIKGGSQLCVRWRWHRGRLLYQTGESTLRKSYRAERNSLQILLSRTRRGRGRTMKHDQENKIATYYDFFWTVERGGILLSCGEPWVLDATEERVLMQRKTAKDLLL